MYVYLKQSLIKHVEKSCKKVAWELKRDTEVEPVNGFSGSGQGTL